MQNLGLYSLVVCGVIVGFSLTSQAGINAQLRTALHSPIQAAFISFSVGTVILGTAAFITAPSWFKSGALAQLPWWAWLGGVLGAFNIAMAIFLAPRLGAVALAVSVVCGQIIASLIYDQHGWLGYPQIALSPSRIVGALLIVIGVFLVAKR